MSNDLIVFHLTVQDVDIIGRSLAEQPFKLVHAVIEKIVNQANSGQPAPGTPLPPTGPQIPSSLATQAVPGGISPPSGVAAAAATLVDGPAGVPPPL